MSFAFIHPPTNGLPSGGNRYNERILQQARRRCFDLTPEAVTDFDREYVSQLNHAYTLLIWDSLFWDKLASLSSVLQTGRSCLLCHYLPSLNPKLDQQRRQQWRTLENDVLRQMRRIIVTGQWTADILHRRYPGKPIDLCTPGIDPIFLRNDKNIRPAGTPPQLLTVANLLSEKGYLDILYVLSGLDSYPWHWHVCGSDGVDAQFAGQFRQTVRRLGLTSRISYHGTLTPPQIAGLMQNTDLWVSASYYESFGMAVAEAAAMRLPIITTATGAAGTMVRHATNGFLFPAGDRQALRRYLQLLLDDGALRLKFRSRQHYRCQTWHQCFETFRSICEKAAEANT